jgi:uncharacterized protein YdeI (YjbR/CyaY-like superfamily)
MAEPRKSSKVDAFLGRTEKWRAEFETLRAIVLESGLTEDLKWGNPCYALDGANIVLMHGFKDYCALLFFKGALLKDVCGVLVQQTENVQSPRQVRFTGIQDIVELESVLKGYISEAIEVEKAGLSVTRRTTADYAVPEEFQNRLDDDPALKAAFDALTPGRQRGYLLYFASAKQSKTREARVEKCTPQILAGQGLDD